MSRRCARFSLLLALTASLQGCGTVVTLPGGYEPKNVAGAQGGSVEAVEVVAGEDERPFKGRSRLGPAFLTLIPLVPYGHQQISPDFQGFNGSMKNDRFVDDVADVVIEDLRGARVARWVGAPDDRLPGRDGAEPAYRLHVNVEEGIYHRNTTLYGMSFMGFFLWVLGAPNSYGSAELVVAVELRDPQGASLGSEKLRGEASATEWLYNGPVSAYSPAMPEAYAEISPRLRAFVLERLPRSEASAPGGPGN